MAAKPKKKKAYNFWEDPNFLSVYESLMEQGLASRNAEQGRLNALRTSIFGEQGSLAQNNLQATEAQNRLAEEMAMKGRLFGGSYFGPQKGAGTRTQAAYAQEGRNIENSYDSQTKNLSEQGLKRNPDGSISPLAPGEQITYNDLTTNKPVTGKYGWEKTAAGTAAVNQARANALAMKLSKITKV